MKFFRLSRKSFLYDLQTYLAEKNDSVSRIAAVGFKTIKSKHQEHERKAKEKGTYY